MPYAKIFGFAVSIVLWNCVTFGEEAEIHRIDPPSLEYCLPETMAVHVVNEKNVPLRWTPVTLSITLAPEDGERSQGITFRSSTNEHGDALLKFDPSLYAKKISSCDLRIETSFPLALPFRKDFEANQNKSWNKVIAIPDKINVTVMEGKMVRVRIVNEEKQEIAGVRISNSESDDNTWGKSVYTDAAGYWEFGPVSKETTKFDRRFLTHPDYLPLELNYTEILQEVTMRRGNKISGTITDEEGNPVADASIQFAGNPSDSKRRVTTDKDGKYQANNLNVSDHLMIVTRPGMVQNVSFIPVAELNRNKDVVMKKAKILRLKFEAEKPEDIFYFGLSVPPMDFGYFGYSRHIKSHQLTRTDDGIFEWNEAPDEEIEYKINSSGYGFGNRRIFTEHPSYRLRPQEEPYVIKIMEEKIPDEIIQERRESGYNWYLPEQMEVVVLDENGQPMPDASVSLHLEYNNGMQNFAHQRDQSFQTDAEGKVLIDFSKLRSYDTRNVVITASQDHYIPARREWTRLYHKAYDFGGMMPERLELPIHLKTQLAGIVRDDLGQPIEGVEVKIIFNRNSVCPPEPVTFVTDANGIWKCNLSDYGDAKSLLDSQKEIVFSKANYITVKMYEFKESPKYSINARLVTLHQTKKVGGRVVDAEGKPVGNVNIMLMNKALSEASGNVQTDAEGYFTLNAGTHVNKNKITLYFYKKGWSPVEIEVDLTQGAEDLSVTLPPGKELKLRFVSDDPDMLPRVVAKVILTNNNSAFLRDDAVLTYDDFPSDENGNMTLVVPDAEMEYLSHSKNENFFVLEKKYRFKPGGEVHVIQLVSKSKFSIPNTTGYMSLHDGGAIYFQSVDNQWGALR